jgi:ribonuclease G
VQELHVERTLTRGLVGNIYLGKVVRVLPGMQSAFIDIGLERAAFLHVADIWHPRDGDKNGHLAIEKTLFEGQALMVQVIKDPIGTKGARLSTQVSIAGRMLVYCRRIRTSASRSDRGRTSARRCAPACRAWCPPTSAAASSCARSPRKPATRNWQRHRLPAQDLGDDPLQRHHPARAEPALPGPEPGPARAARLRQRRHGVIQVDSRENYQKLVEFAQEYTPAVLPRLSHYTGERPIFDLFNIDAEIERRCRAGST